MLTLLPQGLTHYSQAEQFASKKHLHEAQATTKDYTFIIKTITICIFQEQSHTKAGKEKAKGKWFQPPWILCYAND